MITTITLLSILLLILGYAVFNLLRKLETLEDILMQSDTFVFGMTNKIEEATERLKEIDSKGTFESDDEVGWFFKSLLELQEELQSYVDQYAPQKESE